MARQAQRDGLKSQPRTWQADHKWNGLTFFSDIFQSPLRVSGILIFQQRLRCLNTKTHVSFGRWPTDTLECPDKVLECTGWVSGQEDERIPVSDLLCNLTPVCGWGSSALKMELCTSWIPLLLGTNPLLILGPMWVGGWLLVPTVYFLLCLIWGQVAVNLKLYCGMDMQCWHTHRRPRHYMGYP